jgi:hypothetical protein
LKRCFGIFGHLVVANMIIWIIVFVILFIFGISIFSLIPKGYFGVGIL